MKAYKTKITEIPFKLYGYTKEEYLRWCKKHHLRPYETESKRKFFRSVNEHIIVKINQKVLENGEVLE